MKYLRFLLFSFAAIYWLVTSVRNKLYDVNILKSFTIPGKSICIGNLSMGGTGKSPHTIMIAKILLEKNIPVAILSRGYGRVTKGLIEVDQNSTTKDVGDEPKNYKSIFGESTTVVVSEDRKTGVQYIRKKQPNAVILLDDAFQHRKVKAGLNILLTSYSHPFSKDFLFPVGMLRESRMGRKRADLIVVTKCPSTTSKKFKHIDKSLNYPESKILHSTIDYSPLEIPSNNVKEVLLVTGIANSKPLLSELEKHYLVKELKYKDHHQFTEQDLAAIRKKFDSFASRETLIVTTEKDYMRLSELEGFSAMKEMWAIQRISTRILDYEKKFNELICNYAQED